jgi:hypothetical protein
MLTAIQDLYRSTSAPVKAGSKISQAHVTTTRGVKQGCPLSPTLFGIFIDQLEEVLLGAGSALGVSLAFDVEIRDLMFADDITLLSTSASNLQVLVDALHGFCTLTHMDINTLKTEGIRFEPVRLYGNLLQDWQLTCDDTQLKISSEVRYLGAWLHTREWLKTTFDKLVVLARKAMWGLWHRMKQMGIVCLDTKLRLLHTLVTSVGEYACQVWGVYFLDASSEYMIFKSPLQKLVLDFLRLSMGASKCTSRWVLLANAGLQPIQVRWAVMCAKHWGKCSEQGGVATDVMKSDLDLFKKGNTSCWSYKFLKCMSDIGLLGQTPMAVLQRDTSIEALMLHRFDERGITEAFASVYAHFHSRGNPREVDSEGLAMVKYMEWFYSSTNSHLTTYGSELKLQTLNRFRLGCIPLRSNDYKLKHIARSQRVCSICNTNTVEDELHILLECPAYNTIRQQSRLHHELLIHGTDMRKVMDTSDQNALASMIHKILESRKQHLDNMDVDP